MLAAAANLKKIQYPVMGFPKIDGIRAVIHRKQALSRKLIALPNQFIQGFFNHHHFQGLDGELVVGSPNDPLCIKHSTSGVMSRGGEPDFTFYVFDKWDSPYSRYVQRLDSAAVQVREIAAERVRLLSGRRIDNEDDLLAFESEQLDLGYEGIILRSPGGAYKHGRSTVREGGLLKLKRFQDSEARVLEVIEEQFNGNEAQKDNLGRTKRSSAKAGKVGKGRAGALRVKDLRIGVVFEVGTGMTDADKEEWWAWWNLPESQRGRRIVKYKFFAVGMQERPRHPVYITWRHPVDM
jgi:DNA ligase-1